uniref:Uncharacterized protein n=1 Tax=Heterorhabditis bacteriophora TaxID=37862 RepID=A0A1I7XGA6_HETBA
MLTDYVDKTNESSVVRSVVSHNHSTFLIIVHYFQHAFRAVNLILFIHHSF